MMTMTNVEVDSFSMVPMGMYLSIECLFGAWGLFFKWEFGASYNILLGKPIP